MSARCESRPVSRLALSVGAESPQTAPHPGVRTVVRSYTMSEKKTLGTEECPSVTFERGRDSSSPNRLDQECSRTWAPELTFRSPEATRLRDYIFGSAAGLPATGGKHSPLGCT